MDKTMRMKGLACLIIIALAGQGAKAQRTTQGQKGDFWVVVGAFTTQQNASLHAKKAMVEKLQPKVELNEDKNLYYVSVFQTDNHDAARAEARKLQGTKLFTDAWVFTRTPEVEPVVIVEEKPKEVPVIETVVPVVVKPQRMSAADSARLVEERIKGEVDKRVMNLKKGETETLDYIFFYKDASVLRPESRFAVDKLVRIMKENPKEKIRIHGHTNGNDPGKIIKMSGTSTDFFSLKNTVEDEGSAKELSELRATLIRDYLVVNGIDKKRMSIKAWGGKKPLYKVDDPKAEANVRVEIEVVQNEE